MPLLQVNKLGIQARQSLARPGNVSRHQGATSVRRDQEDNNDGGGDGVGLRTANKSDYVPVPLLSAVYALEASKPRGRIS